MTDNPIKPKIILIRENALKSWARDASTFALIVSLIGVGWFLNSVPLQWVGAIVAFISIFYLSTGWRKEITFTIAEARAELDRLEKAAVQS